MTTSNGNGTSSAGGVRNAYREGQVLRARDLERDREYVIGRIRQHAAFAHGAGIVEGLRLTAMERGTSTAVTEYALDPTKPKALDLAVSKGIAIDTLGRVVVVPRREDVRTELARDQGRKQGWYQLLLQYDQSSSGTTANGARLASACGEDSGSVGSGSGVVRETYRLRLAPEDEAVVQPDSALVLQGSVDDPTLLAPIKLGYVYWNGADAYTSYSTADRQYVAVRAQGVLSPDDGAAFELRDENGRASLRTSPLGVGTDADDPFAPAAMEERVRIDPDGTTWVQAQVMVGPDGVGFRPTEIFSPSNWKVVLHEVGEKGERFDSKADASQADYMPGSRELRVLFERENGGQNGGEGRRRVVIGHVDDTGQMDSFRPALIMYDLGPTDGGAGQSIVEVWGDLHVQGTAYLRQVKHKSDETVPDRLDQIMTQLAGPAGGMLTSYLLTSTDWLSDLAKALGTIGTPQANALTATVAQSLPLNSEFTAFTNAIAGKLPQVALFDALASAARSSMQPALQGDEAFQRAVVGGFAEQTGGAPQARKLALKLAALLNEQAHRKAVLHAARELIIKWFQDPVEMMKELYAEAGISENDAKESLKKLLLWSGFPHP